MPSIIFATHRSQIDSYQELYHLRPTLIQPEMQRLGYECPDPQYCFTEKHQTEYGKDIDIAYFKAEANGYKPTELALFRHIDGIGNKASIDEWLTEIQLPVEKQY